MFEALTSLITVDNVGAAGVGAVGVVLAGMLKNGVVAGYAKVKSVISAVEAVKAKIDADAATALKMVQVSSIPAKPTVAPATVAPAVQVAPVIPTPAAS